MSSSTLRRLANDHRSLHADLPPNYLFPPSSASDSIPDDLTRLTILLAGPQGTPYSKGVWKLQIKIPEDYPKSPPKAAFRTRIWHPNVEESTGSVCVETLKRDWDSELTLRDVLVTISCLLIQPNPDSALNSAAGQLLQEDYEAYARQAKLMTSIHAMVPADLREAVVEAKRTGEEAGTELREDQEQESNAIRHASSSSSSVVMKPRPGLIPRTLATSDRSLGAESGRLTPQHLTLQPPTTTSISNENNAEEDDQDEEASECKENDPSLSPSPVTPPTPRKNILGKRPLSDLPTPTVPEDDDGDGADNRTDKNSSEKNIANNTPPSSAEQQPCTITTAGESHRRSPKLVERSKALNSGRVRDDSTDASIITSFEDSNTHDDVPAPKRICSGEGKENFTEVDGDKTDKLAATPKPTPTMASIVPTSGAARQVSTASSSSGGSGRVAKPRIGLRRL